MPQTKKQTHNHLHFIPIHKFTAPQIISLAHLVELPNFQLIFGDNYKNEKDIESLVDNSYLAYLKNITLNHAHAIGYGNLVIGYFEIRTTILDNINGNNKKYNYCLKFYLNDPNQLPDFNTLLLNYLHTHNIDKLDIWTYIDNTDFKLITKLINNYWLFVKKQDQFNFYIIDKRIVNKRTDTKKILWPSSKKYDPLFTLSVKTKHPDLNNNILRDYLINAKLRESKDVYRRPMFLYMEPIENNLLDRRYYNTKCFIMNILSKAHKVITDKHWLYLNFNKLFPNKCRDYMAWTIDLINLNPDLVLKEHNIYITRPVGRNAYSGRGIVVVSDKASLQKANSNINKYENVIASEYILNPFLFEGKKTHFRCYLLASILNGVYSTWLFDFFELFHAKLPYIHGDWENKDIHDTHHKSTTRNIFAPDDLEPELQQIFRGVVWPKMQDCMRYVSMILEGHAEPYDNAANAFEIFGCDILVRDNYDIVLMEVNEHTGLAMHPEPAKIQEFSEKYFEYINDCIINPAIREIPCSRKPLYTKRIEK
jgi:preprotein translocase subunit SecE